MADDCAAPRACLPVIRSAPILRRRCKHPPDYDLDVEIESRLTENAGTQQTQFATVRQHGLQLRQQVAILAAQIEKTLFCADYKSAYGHSFEHRIGMAMQQDAIFERARLAFIGIANHIVRSTLCLATKFPFHAGTESCATPSAQP